MLLMSRIMVTSVERPSIDRHTAGGAHRTGTGVDVERPSWQRDTCPPWCATVHHEDDPPEDRHHDGTAHDVPLLLGIRAPGTSSYEAVPTEVLAVRTRRHGEREDWIYVGEPDRVRQHLVVTPEGARRLAEILRVISAD